MPIADVREADCKLMRNRPELARDFNDLVARINRVEARVPALFEQLAQGLGTRLAKVRDLLTLDTYRVGFLGNFQSGKSTCLNRLVNANPALDEEPGKSGGGGATTAVATRVRVDPNLEGHRLTVEYLSAGEYRAKLERLCTHFGLPAAADRPALAAALARAIKDAAAEGRTDRVANLEDLKRYLESHDPQYVLTAPADGRPFTPRADGRLYEHRKFYINRITKDNQKLLQDLQHAHGKHPAEKLADAVKKNPLIRSVRIDFRARDVEVPPELEIVDLPGLNSTWHQDTDLTREFLPQLQGAMIFCHATQLDAEWISDLLQERLRGIFPGGMTERVWVVFTYCDALTSAHLSDSADWALLRFLRNQGVKHSQVCFTCGEWYAKGPDDVKAHLKEKTGTEAHVPARLRDEANERRPGSERTCLHDAFEALLQKGGIGRLRHLVAKQLKDQVEAETQRDIAHRLHDLREALRLQVESWKQTHHPDSDLEGLMTRHRNKLQEVITHLLRDPTIDDVIAVEPQDYFGDAADGLRQALTKVLDSEDTGCPMSVWLAGAKLPELAAAFPLHSNNLQNAYRTHLLTHLVPELYARIKAELAPLAAPPLALESYPTDPGEALLQEAHERLLADDRAGGLPTFLSPHLFAAAAPAKPAGAGVPGLQVWASLTGPEYRKMLEQKVRLVTHQTIHALRRELCRQLQGLRDLIHDAFRRGVGADRQGGWDPGLEELLQRANSLQKDGDRP